MKTAKTITASILFLFITINGAQAQSCNSAAQVVADIWGKTHNVAIQAGCVVAQAAGYVDYASCFTTAQKINDLTGKLVTFWNSKVSNSWATIGPRRLELNKNLNGTLVSTGGRKFVSFPVFKNRITITIDETSGKGKASVVVCKTNKQGQHSKVATKWFNDTNARKNKTNEKRTVTVNGAKNHIISVHLDGKSVGNTFGYRLRAN